MFRRVLPTTRAVITTANQMRFATAKAAKAPLATTPVTDIPTHRDLVRAIMTSETYYKPEALDSEINSFFTTLQLPMLYHLTFSPQHIANHIHAMIAAKEMAQGKGDLEFKVDGKDHALFVCSSAPESRSRTEKQVDEYIRDTPNGMGASLFSFQTKSPIMGSANSVLYIVSREVFGATPAQGTDINVLATREFLWNRPSEIRGRYQAVLKGQAASMGPVASVENPANPGDDTIVSIAVPTTRGTQGRNYMSAFSRLAERLGITFEKKFAESFANDITVYQLYSASAVADDVMRRFLLEAEIIAFVPVELDVLASSLDSYRLLYFHLAVSFANHFVSQTSDEYVGLLADLKGRANFNLRNMQKKLSRELLTFERVLECLTQNQAYAGQCYDDFINKVQNHQTVGQKNVDLFNRFKRTVLDPIDLEILENFLAFNSAVTTTNFFKQGKSSVACKLDGSFLKKTMYAPSAGSSGVYRVFMVLGNGFQGFTALKAPQARGGINLINTKNIHAYQQYVGELYFVTDQMMKIMEAKNKDIAPSGAGTFIVSRPELNNKNELVTLQYVGGVLDIAEDDYLYYGPGTNTEGLMASVMKFAKGRIHYPTAAFATGKSAEFGGIEHDKNDMAVAGRQEFIQGTYKRLHMDPTQVRKVITGGPDCAEAFAEIRYSTEKIIVIVDKHGILCDFEGLNKEELINLGNSGKSIRDYDLKKSSPSAFRITKDQKGFTCPFTKHVIDNAETYVTNFLQNPPFTADILVLCEPRLYPVSQSHLNECFTEDGKPKIPIVIEAINMAYTEDMRLNLEERGYVLFKDASANKGAVICSSFEVLAALAFTPSEFLENMCPSASGNVSAFRKEFVEECKYFVKRFSKEEFDHIEREVTRGGLRTQISNSTTKKIRRIEDEMQKDEFFIKRPQLVERALKSAIPKSLIDKLTLPLLMSRVPEAMLRSVFATEIARQYVYRQGLQTDEFDLHQFLEAVETGKLALI
eukprot:PhF_6_TR9199/c0_g1_i1/m.14401/K15371/GDH2; glutamate dehydrogenase